MWVRNLLVIGLILSFLGCATLPDPRITSMEAKIEKMEKQIKTAMASGSGAKTIYGFYGLTGGDPALDGIITTSVDDGSYAMGIDTSGNWYLYYFDADSTTTASTPSVIDPVTGPGRWLIAPKLYANSFTTSSPDLYHYINISNSGNPSFSKTDGDMYTRTDSGVIYIYNSADVEDVPLISSKRVNSSSNLTLQHRHQFGATVTNRGATGTITFTLQDAENGMEVTILAVAAQSIYIRPHSTDKIIYSSTICDNPYDRLMNSTPTIGDFVTLRAINSGTNFDWYVVARNGVWTDAN